MLFRALAIAAFLLIATAPSGAQPVPVATGSATDWFMPGSDLPADPAWRFGTLPNGARYAVRRNARPERQVSIRIRIGAGSLHERPEELGWAHLVEHLAFRGSASFADREARHIWQQLGASFGSDTNAFTGITQTFYQLDLPNADREKLDRSLAVMADMLSSALFDPAAVEAERGIVMAEKERRPELGVRVGEAGRELFGHGLSFATREPIGTDDTLRAATAEGLRAFYRRWYRPDRATIVLVGDFDPDQMVQLIEARFGGWRSQGPAPAEPDFGRPATPSSPVAEVNYPGAPLTATIAWTRPYFAVTPSRASQLTELKEMLAATIINRRLERRARAEAAFIAAGISRNAHPGTADVTQLALTVRGDAWQPALAQAFAIIADARRSPPSQAEIERELTNLRTASRAAVEAEPTTASPVHATRLVNAIDQREPIVAARDGLALLEAFAPQMTPERIAAATERLFADAAPRLLLLTPTPLADGAAALATAFAETQVALPSMREDERSVSFDALPWPGAPGREVARERIDDLDVTIVRFANGSTLTFKPTRFDEGRVFVRLRFGHGLSGLDPRQASLGWAAGFVGPSGVADLDLDGMERLMTGRRMSLSFGIDEDAFQLTGATSATDLPDQLRLLTAKLTQPRWDPALFRRYQTNALQGYDLQFASAAARGQRELSGLVRPGDQRFSPVSREALAAATPEGLRAFYEPPLTQSAIHGVIVGDLTLDQAIAAFLPTIAALPARNLSVLPTDWVTANLPRPNAEPARFTHRGDPAQAFAVIGWTTVGGEADVKVRRALALAGNLFQARLFESLREAEGAAYSPSATHLTSDTFRNWGILYAASEVRPDRVAVFLRIARETIADLAARPASAEEFVRAQNPVVSGIERRVMTNGYWLDALEGLSDPARRAEVRSYLADYRGLTPEDVRAAIAAHVTDAGDWSMVVLPERTVSASPAAAPAPPVR